VAAYRRIALATILIVILLVGGYFWGIPLLARIGTGSSAVVTHNSLGTADNIPPSSPRLDGLPDSSRTRVMSISGSAESGATISVLVNDREQINTLADKNGQFKGEVSLTGGANRITATAKDSVGNESRPSKAITVIYDATPPKLLVTSPASRQTATDSPTMVISGKTDAAANVAINDRQIIVQPDGGFSSSVSLNSGGNTIVVTATDSAGNTAKSTLAVTYTPKQASSSATAQ
jgi:hypothetical protein